MTNVRFVTGVDSRRASPDKVKSPALIKEEIAGIANDRARILAAVLYLTGSRITEIVGGTSKYTDKKTRKVKQRKVKGFRPVQLVKNEEKNIWRFEALEVIKKRKKIGKRIAVVAPWHNDLVDLIQNYIRGIPREQRVFQMTRQGAWKMFVNAYPENPLWCHYFRHAHVTHLIREGGMNHVMAGKQMDWDNISHLSTYTKYDISDIEDHFLEVQHKKEVKKV